MSRKLKRRQDLRVFATTAGFQNSGKLEDFVISRPAIDNLDGIHVSAATFALWGLPGVRKGLRLDHAGRPPHEHEILVEFNGPAVRADAGAYLDALRDIVAGLNPTAILCRTADWWTGTLLDLQTELRAASKPCPHMYFNLPGGPLNSFFSRTGEEVRSWASGPTAFHASSTRTRSMRPCSNRRLATSSNTGVTAGA